MSNDNRNRYRTNVRTLACHNYRNDRLNDQLGLKNTHSHNANTGFGRAVSGAKVWKNAEIRWVHNYSGK